MSISPLRTFVAACCVAALACSDPPIPPPAGFVSVSTAPPTVEVTYIAGEGVLLSSGEDRVLVDGLHRLYQREYAHLPAREQELIETAQAPFDGIDVVLVSHMHGDHFHPTAVRRHLEHNASSLLVSSQQVTDAVKKDASGNAGVLSRITAMTPEPGTSATRAIGSITVQFLGLPHGGSRWQSMQNLGHVITIGGKKFLHVGDTEGTIADFAPFKLADAGIDVALLPSWILSEGEGPEVVMRHIKPKQIVAVHLGSSAVDNQPVINRIQQVFPEAAVFATLLERRRY